MSFKHLKMPIKRYPYVYTQKVAWGEMDALQHVNHVMYAKYFENARVEFFKDLSVWESENFEYGPVVAKLEMQFKKQVRYPSTLDVTIGLLNLQSRSFTFGCTIWDQNNELVFISMGDFYWIHFPSSKITMIPQKFKEKFQPYFIR